MRRIPALFRQLVGFSLFVFKGGAAAARRMGVTVGEDCRIYVRSFGSEPSLITIGDRTTITSGVRILTHDGATSLVKNEGGHRFQRYAAVKIGDDVFVGVNAIILPGITIGSRVIVAAGSVVTRDVASGNIVGGNPARVIGSFESYHAKISATCPNDEDLRHAETYEDRVALAMEIAAARVQQQAAGKDRS